MTLSPRAGVWECFTARSQSFCQTPMLCCNAAGDVHAMLSRLLKHDVVGVLALVPNSEFCSAPTAYKHLRDPG
jgi:hypothetical protein